MTHEKGFVTVSYYNANSAKIVFGTLGDLLSVVRYDVTANNTSLTHARAGCHQRFIAADTRSVSGTLKLV